MTGTAGELSGAKPRRMNGQGREEVEVPRDPFDWYVEPAWCVDLLLRGEHFPGVSWDPCAGSGTIPKRVRAIGLDCRASDIIDRGHFDLRVLDFTAINPEGWDVDHIIMNPPYRQGEAFIRQALMIARWKVAALMQAKFLYSAARYPLFTGETRPRRIYHLSARPSMPPGELLMAGKIKASGGKLDYCWIVWDAQEPPETGTRTYWLKRDRRSELAPMTDAELRADSLAAYELALAEKRR